MDSNSETKLISLISQIRTIETSSDAVPIIIQTISLVKSLDLDLQPKPESKLMSVVTQTISFCNSMDLVSQPKPLPQLISLITRLVNSMDTFPEQNQVLEEFDSLFGHSLRLKPEPELISLIYQIVFLAIHMNPEFGKLISVCPQVKVFSDGGKFHVDKEAKHKRKSKVLCLPMNWDTIVSKGEDATHFLCAGCNGKNHEEYEKAPLEVRHPLHPKHSLHLVYLEMYDDYYQGRNRECYCCAVNLKRAFYYCSACDFAMNIACVDKSPILAIDHPKRHEHRLVLFPRLLPITCNLCALADSSFAIYMCPPCDFFVHARCISLPRVIKISRHPHRISFTSSFDERDWSCGICHREIDNDYGGFSCIKGCLYAAHSKCATQENVWNGIELERHPEDIEEEEEIKTFERISYGVILHFRHQQHLLKLDENTDRDYDMNKQCQACITPIYFGNFYSCMVCEFILHEDCVNLSRKIHHWIHPHMLTLVGGYDNFMDYDHCSACLSVCTGGFFYKCDLFFKCPDFKLHGQCATISEPLVFGSHVHPLFLISKPGVLRECSACKSYYEETFICIEDHCDFSLCFRCSTLPQKLRYKHDKHMLTLCYGEDASTEAYWCEVCEGKVNPQERFYKCDEYCCVTLHIDCLIGKDLYMKLGSSFIFLDKEVRVLPNNQRMTRPFCSWCGKRCPYNIAFQYFEFILCSMVCVRDHINKLKVLL